MLAKKEKERIQGKDKRIAQYAEDNNMDPEALEEAIKSCQEGGDRQKLEDFIKNLESEKQEIESEIGEITNVLTQIKADKKTYLDDLAQKDHAVLKFAQKFQIEGDLSQEIVI